MVPDGVSGPVEELPQGRVVDVTILWLLLIFVEAVVVEEHVIGSSGQEGIVLGNPASVLNHDVLLGAVGEVQQCFPVLVEDDGTCGIVVGVGIEVLHVLLNITFSGFDTSIGSIHFSCLQLLLADGLVGNGILGHGSDFDGVVFGLRLRMVPVVVGETVTH